MNCKLLIPGQTRLLREGDQIRIGRVEYNRRNQAFRDRDIVYVFRQFTTTYPEGLAPEHLQARKRLDELERERSQL